MFLNNLNLKFQCLLINSTSKERTLAANSFRNRKRNRRVGLANNEMP